MSAPGTAPAWDLEWAAERAAVAMRYLAENCPASAGAPELHHHQDEAHAATVRGDRAVADAYMESRPTARARWGAYVEARQESERLQDALVVATNHAGPAAPAELQGGTVPAA